jgi:hypothetical protein
MSHEVWKDSRQEVLFFDGSDPRTDWLCQVRLGDGQIEVVYEDDDGRKIRYVGSEIGTGHFELKSAEADGRATLHMFKGGKVLEGYWAEGDVRGMWRIALR